MLEKFELEIKEYALNYDTLNITEKVVLSIKVFRYLDRLSEEEQIDFIENYIGIDVLRKLLEVYNNYIDENKKINTRGYN